jgi:mannose-6-phosphate isomerase-like protein (cupin superfamily)
MSFPGASIAALSLLVWCPAAAQELATRKPGGATLVTATEVRAAVEKEDTAAVADAMLHLVPIMGKYNVGVSVVRRSQVDGKAPPDAIMHEAITEVYHIIEGRGVLVTGGTVDRAVRLPADDPVVREVIDPSFVGKTISGGTGQQVGPGAAVFWRVVGLAFLIRALASATFVAVSACVDYLDSHAL